MKIGKDKILSCLPQRAPFIMIDNLLEATHDLFETDFKITSQNIFLENGVLREFALIENIAQSCAAGLYSINQSQENKQSEGFIGGISKLRVFDLPKLNDIVYTRITPVTKLGNMFLMKGENYVEGNKLLECYVKIVAK